MKTSILALLCSLSTALLSSGQVPSLINYQGRLTDASGSPITGNKNFAISIFDAATGGNLLYSETIGAVTLDSNGVYSFQFGSAGTSNTQVTETISTTDGTTLIYSKVLANSPVVNNSITVTDGINSWSQSVGNPGAGATATATTTAGFVIGATITSGGSGYTNAPTVTISGNGAGATATATLTDGVVTGITIVSAGSGYTNGATITIAPPVIPFRVEYASGTITATYASAPTAGRAIAATYRYVTGGIADALGNTGEHWMAITVEGVTQSIRQRVLAVPFAQRAGHSATASVATSAVLAQTANSANTVVDGAITASKLAPNTITEAIGNSANLVMIATGNRPDLLSQGYIEVSKQSSMAFISNTNAPSERNEHTAIWTGTEMIIWGGNNSTSRLNTGGRYNPTTNSWTSISTTGAPSARVEHTAIWTGSEMIVWGGTNYTSKFNTGGRYNPTTNTWTAISTTNAPSARNGHTAIWTGSEMIVWGGTDGNTTNSGARYNPSTNSWSSLSITNAPIGRKNHTSVWTGSHMIVWGGNRVIVADTIHLNDGAIYNAANNTWSALASANAPSIRSYHTATWTGEDMIIFGGSPTDSSNKGSKYNFTTNQWTALSDLNSPSVRARHTAVWNNIEIIFWGGTSAPNVDFGFIYSSNKNEWNQIATSNSPSNRSLHTAIWTGNEMIVWGGREGTTFLNTGEKYKFLVIYAAP